MWVDSSFVEYLKKKKNTSDARTRSFCAYSNFCVIIIFLILYVWDPIFVALCLCVLYTEG